MKKPAAQARVVKPSEPVPVVRATAESPIAGKGMWIYQLKQVAKGNEQEIARLASAQGLTHIFVRVGSGKIGLATLDEALRVLPAAHDRNIKVIAWYFPYYNDIPADVANSARTINARYQGHSFDGFAADIETAPGAKMNAATVGAYSSALRAAEPSAYLISVPPRVTSATLKSFPYAAMMPHYDAVAPMVYWGRFDVEASVRSTVNYLRSYGKPIFPIGQMYNMGPEGGPNGNPPPHQTWAFMRTAKELGLPGVSFWSWQHANSKEWRALRLFRW